MTKCDPYQDKILERERYEERAANHTETDDEKAVGVESVVLSLRTPYLSYAEKLKKYIKPQSKVLEIGAGTGEFTDMLFHLTTYGFVVATDISGSSLELLQKRYNDVPNLQTRVADMESLPFENELFDVVCSAGSLSYGDNIMVMNEIYRVIKRGGVFVCVDSLNHNPIYKLNRWIHYKRGHRSLSVIRRTPKITLINAYGDKFGLVESYYYGSVSWAIPFLLKLMPVSKASLLSDWIDKKLSVKNIKKAAFKFVMVVTKI
jgi:ubiquinone/menaquinone biosynthesis C-methylase UbiE